MKRTIVGFAVLVVAIIAVTLLTHNKKEVANKPVTIRVADQGLVANALFDIAYDQKLFEKQGLDVQIVHVQTPDEALRALMTKDTDVALAGVIPFSFMAIDNPQPKIFANLAYASDNRVLYRKDKVSKPEDLKGKTVGYSKSTASEVGWEEFLKSNNLQKSDLNWVEIKPTGLAGAIASGQIVAYSSWEPNISNGVKLLGDNAGIFEGPGSVYTWEMNFIADNNYINSNKESLKKFVAATREAQDFLNQNHDKSVQIVSNFSRLTPEVISSLWSNYDYRVRIGEDLPQIIDGVLAFVNEHRDKKVDSVPSGESLINRSIIEHAEK